MIFIFDASKQNLTVILFRNWNPKLQTAKIMALDIGMDETTTFTTMVHNLDFQLTFICSSVWFDLVGFVHSHLIWNGIQCYQCSPNVEMLMQFVVLLLLLLQTTKMKEKMTMAPHIHIIPVECLIKPLFVLMLRDCFLFKWRIKQRKLKRIKEKRRRESVLSVNISTQVCRYCLVR